MKKLTLFLTSLFIASGIMAEVNYTPENTGTRTREDKFVSSVSVNGNTFSLTQEQSRSAYVDITASKTFTIKAGANVSLRIQDGGGTGWMNAYVYIDTDHDGFTAGVAENGYTPTGDLVSYSFYNNGSSSDLNGWNSAGKEISDSEIEPNPRSTLDLPDFIAPEIPGTYRIRFKYDWCNIDPDGGKGTYFGKTFFEHGGAIIDLTLDVVETDETPVNDIDEFVSGKIYTFESKRGWLVAGADHVYNSVKMGTDAAGTSNENCQWVLYRNESGAYLYNTGAGKFIAADANDRNIIPLSATPTTSSVEFKKSAVDEYPIIIGVDNCAINQNSTKSEYPYGAILWSNGWTDARWYGDEGSCHKAICIGDASEEIMDAIAARTEVYENSKNCIEIAPATGTLYKWKDNTDKTGETWNYKWVSTNTDPQIVITSDLGRKENNIQTAANNTAFDFRGGNGDNGHTKGNETFNISVSAGYVITGYGFKYKKASNYNAAATINIGDETITVGTEYAEYKKENISSYLVQFTVNENNEGIIFSDFYINVKKSETANGSELFVTRSGGIPYRIPAIAQASNGNLIAVADYRHSGSDIGVINNGRIDLHARISENNGADWGSTFAIIEGKGSSSTDFMNVGFGDPCIVADRESNRVLLLSCAGNVSFQNGTRDKHQNIARFYSEDNGETWSNPVDIAEEIYSMWDNSSNHGPAKAMFVGSGKIHQSRYVKVNDYYRLYCAVLLRNNNNAYTNFVLYSDDFGGSWDVLGGVENAPIPSDGDEPKVEELPNGNIVISSRCNGGRHFNIFTFTNADKAEGSWGTRATSNSSNSGVAATDNSCNGEILIVPALHKEENRNVWIALQSVPFGNGRNNVGIYYKVLESTEDYDTPANFAKNWDGRLQVSTIGSAYSTMCLQNNGTLAFLYEEETYNAQYTIQYKNFTLENITNGRYSYFVNKYKITYTIDGEELATAEYAEGEKITSVDAPEREGYTFIWNNLPAHMPAEDITVEGTYNVITYAVTYMVDGEVYKTDSITYGSDITLAEAPEKEGYTFSGWSETPETMPANDITVEGTFTANTYAVTYMVDGEVYKTDSVAYGSDITLAEAPEKEGYTFSGWSETPGTMPANDFTVEGTFTVNTYAVTYMVDGEVYKTDSVAYGSVITLAEAPEKEGHTFDGWSEIPETMPANDITVEGTFTINSYTVTFVVDGETYTTSSVEYGAEITVPDMEEKEGHTFNWNEHPATMPANDITVEGGYTTNIYAVTYMVDGEVYKTDSVAYGSGITLAEAPEKEGHTFNGWSEIPETMPANDITVEGTFTVNRYRITYMVDDTPYFTLRIKYGEKITPLQDPQKDGYTFSGWSEIPETMPAEDIVITGYFTSEDGETTSAKLITDNNNDILIYNIKGERILNTENLERGLYIINGKTVYVK